MEGTVLGYSDGEGVIKGSDGTRFPFARSDWMSPEAPAAGQRVDFLGEEGRAKAVYLLGREELSNGSGEGPAGAAAAGVRWDTEKTMPAVVYGCYLAGLLYGLTMVLGVMIAYVYRRSAQGSWYQSHYDFQIAIFWKSLAGFVIGFGTIFFGIGVVVLVLTYLWVIFKVIGGWRQLAEGRAVG